MKKRIRLQRPYVNKAYGFMFKKDYIPKKYNILYGGTGSSKSFSMWSKLIEMCIRYSTFDILIARKYATTLHDTVEIPILNIMTKFFKNSITGTGLVEGRDYTYNKTHKHIKFSTGSIIRLKGYDNPEKLKGIDAVNVLVLEEVTDFTQEDLEDVQDRLRGTPPSNHPWGKELKVFMMFNPIFKTHWLRTYFFEDNIDMSEEVHKDIIRDQETTAALKTTWRDNAFYNGQYKNDKLRNKMKGANPRKYGVQCNGNWGVLGELIYENTKVIKCIQDESYYDDISYGLDFGFEHNTGIYKLGFKDGDVFVLKEIYKPKMTVNDIIKAIKKAYPDAYRKIRMFCDNARPEAIEEMKRQGIKKAESCKKGANSVVEGIDWLQDRTIYIDEKCVGAANEVDSYQWQKDKKTGDRLPKPIKVNDDAMDAIRYGCQKWRESKKAARIRQLG